jgi:hypothetical protein
MSCATGGGPAPGKGSESRPVDPSLEASAGDASTGVDASAIASLGFVEIGRRRVVLEGPPGDAGAVNTSVELVRPKTPACLRVAFVGSARIEARLVTSGVYRASVVGERGFIGPEGPVCVAADARATIELSGPRGAEVALVWLAPAPDAPR